jgi:8-oxo-dGTP pyrophosphatase MutT (NUDIX family)
VVSEAAAHLAVDLRSVLEGWAAPTPEQDLLRRAYLRHLDAHPDAVLKAGPPAHFTASCIVLDGRGEMVLLTHHKRANAWFQFGGHLEPGDTGLHAAAAREAREESGIGSLVPLGQPVALDRHTLVGDFGRCREHLDVRFAALAPEGASPATSEESHDVRWWPVAELPAFAEPALVAHVRLAQLALALA